MTPSGYDSPPRGGSKSRQAPPSPPPCEDPSSAGLSRQASPEPGDGDSDPSPPADAAAVASRPGLAPQGNPARREEARKDGSGAVPQVPVPKLPPPPRAPGCTAPLQACLGGRRKVAAAPAGRPGAAAIAPLASGGAPAMLPLPDPPEEWLLVKVHARAEALPKLLDLEAQVTQLGRARYVDHLHAGLVLRGGGNLAGEEPPQPAMQEAPRRRGEGGGGSAYQPEPSTGGSGQASWLGGSPQGHRRVARAAHSP